MSLRSGWSVVLLLILLSLCSTVNAQQHDHASMTQPPTAQTPTQQQELNTATAAMSSHDHEHHMGPHMRMSTLRPANAGDTEKAQQIVVTARASLEKYQDVRAAE